MRTKQITKTRKRKNKRLTPKKIMKLKIYTAIEMILIVLILVVFHDDLIKIEGGGWYCERLPKAEQVAEATKPDDKVEEPKAEAAKPEEPKPEEVTNRSIPKRKATEVSEEGLNLIKRFEGLKLTAYKLKGEKHYTIGYGHTGKDVKPGQKITKAEAERQLRAEAQKVANHLNKKDLELNQNELDALVSFGFNCGIGNLDKLIQGRSKEEIAEHMIAYTKSKSEAHRKGLTTRRNAEIDMFNGGE